MDPSNTTYVLVTGANSGLGLGTCHRLIDEFLTTRSVDQKLYLIITTRSTKKSKDTISALQSAAKTHPSLKSSSAAVISERVTVASESLELTSLLSVRACARRLLSSSIPRLDVVILNAGIWGVYGINFPKAIWRVMTDTVYAVTFPDYHLSTVGAIAKPQFPALPDDAPSALQNEPILGETFTANVFGHYVLVHELMPLLRVPVGSPLNPARIIWISSQDAVDVLSYDDLQGLRAKSSYENSKRVTDLLALTAALFSSSKPTSKFLSPTTTRPLLDNAESPDSTTTQPPQILLTHPGMLTTNIIPLPWPLPTMWMLILCVARGLGSPWHSVTAYAAAIAPVFLALISSEALSKLHSPSGEDGGGVGKWGSSSVGWLGKGQVKRTFVTGWGLGGKVDDGPHWDSLGLGNKKDGTLDRWTARSGRRRDAKRPTQEDIEHVQEEGAEVWKQMEELREDWMKRCDLYDEWVEGQKGQKSTV